MQHHQDHSNPSPAPAESRVAGICRAAANGAGGALGSKWLAWTANAFFLVGAIGVGWKWANEQRIPWWLIAMIALGLLVMLAPHARTLVRRSAASDSPETNPDFPARDPAADYLIRPGIVIPPDAAWNAVPRALVPPTLGVVVDGKFVPAASPASSPFPEGYPSVRIDGGAGARLHAYPKVTQMSVTVTNCGEKPVSLGFRLFQPMDGLTPLTSDGHARDRVQLAPIEPEHQDRTDLAVGESKVIERVYFWPLSDADLAAAQPGFAQNLTVEVTDYTSTLKPIEFHGGSWP